MYENVKHGYIVKNIMSNALSQGKSLHMGFKATRTITTKYTVQVRCWLIMLPYWLAGELRNRSLYLCILEYGTSKLAGTKEDEMKYLCDRLPIHLFYNGAHFQIVNTSIWGWSNRFLPINNWFKLEAFLRPQPRTDLNSITSWTSINTYLA